MSGEKGFSYAEVASVTALMKGNQSTPEWKEDMIEAKLVQISSRLSAWFPTLKKRWLNADLEDPIADFVPAIVAEAVKKYVDNPDGMSSETMGPYAYSRFDAQDVFKSLFNQRDLDALSALLRGSQATRKAVKVRTPNSYPAAPMPRPGVYTNSQRWKSDRRSRGQRHVW